MVGDTEPKRFRLVIDLLALLTAISLCLSAWLFYERITTSRAAQASTISAIRTVLCFAQGEVESDPTVTPQQKERAIRFYTEALKKVHALPCPPIVARTS
jgi:hypothetical protein